MWKWVRVGRRSASRGFLTQAFRCDEAWERAVRSPLCAPLHLDELYSRADRQSGRMDSVDLDALALGAARTGTHLDELRDLLHKHRASVRATSLPPSTHYSVVRAFAAHDRTADLLDILDDRLNYGVFLCRHTAALLLDDLLASSSSSSNAARVASLLALQEDFEGPIAESLSLLAAYRYATSCSLAQPEPPPPADAAPPPPRKKAPEVVKIRVQFLRNPFFDDHFDLRDPKLLAGKTLIAIGRDASSPLALNARLLGFALYEKFDRAAAAVPLVLRSGLYKDTLELIRKVADANRGKPTFQPLEEILARLQAAPSLPTAMEDDIALRIRSAVQAHETREIQRQVQLFDEWEADRKQKFKEQIEEMENRKRSEAIALRENELKKIDDYLWFFDNEHKVDLAIASKFKMFPKRWHGKKKPPKKIVDTYVPPLV